MADLLAVGAIGTGFLSQLLRDKWVTVALPRDRRPIMKQALTIANLPALRADQVRTGWAVQARLPEKVHEERAEQDRYDNASNRV